jgi:hypothetical protein
MPQIVLTPEQLSVLANSSAAVEALDQDGRTVARLEPLSPEEIAAIEEYKRTRGQPKGPEVTGERVLAFLHRLDELDESGSVDDVTVGELLRRTVAGEPL